MWSKKINKAKGPSSTTVDGHDRIHIANSFSRRHDKLFLVYPASDPQSLLSMFSIMFSTMFYISYIPNAMLVHGISPDSFSTCASIPIPKNRRLDLSDSGNYRAIALSSIFGKVLDKVIMNKQSKKLSTSDYQFGFKKGCSTIICSILLSETVEYYVSNHSSVFVLLIDASKAFDRVSHLALFSILYKKTIMSHCITFVV